MNKFLSLLILAALFGVSGYFGFFYYRALENDKARTLAALEKERQDVQILGDLQKIYIDDFKAELKQTADDYKNYIGVLNEIVAPQNFASPDEAAQTYLIFLDEITPALREKAENILKVFKIYRARILRDVNSQQGDAAQLFFMQWKDMHKEQLERTVALLSFDERLIQAYEDLVTFYYVHSKLYDVDVEAEEFFFKRVEDEKKQDALRDAIQNILREKITLRQK